VEYATRDQAQNAVNTLSNQQLMGRLVYVREVRLYFAAAATSSFPPTPLYPNHKDI
jgi:RNA recognition motif-containing protein